MHWPTLTDGKGTEGREVLAFKSWGFTIDSYLKREGSTDSSTMRYRPKALRATWKERPRFKMEGRRHGSHNELEFPRLAVPGTYHIPIVPPASWHCVLLHFTHQAAKTVREKRC